MPDGPIEVFFSYAHEDEALVGRLIKQLAVLKRQNVIRDWHDRKITAGSEWKGEIDGHLESAGVILLCVSADFLASDYCWDVETRRALERHDAGAARVIPILLRACDWHGAPFGKLQGLPRDMKAITSWANPDEAFTDVARGIRRTVEELRGSIPTPGAELAPASPVSTERTGVNAGAGGIAIGGNVSGSTLVAGKRNRVWRG